MRHLDEGQVVLAAARGERALGAEDATHLQSCAQCRALVDGEARLSEAVRRVPQPDPPADLAARTVAAWRSRQRRRRALVAIGIAFAALVFALFVVLAGVGLAHLDEGVLVVARAVKVAAVVARALATVLSGLPWLATAIAGAMACSLALSAGAVHRLAGVERLAK